MCYCSDKIEKLRKLPNSHALLFIAAKVLGGIGIGVLLAIWMDPWFWWVFMVIACVVAIPVVRKLCSK
jgi:F0F1-type ATP synthase assembly protein I